MTRGGLGGGVQMAGRGARRLARHGEGGDRVEIEGQRRVRRALGRHGQPVRRLRADQAGVQRHRRGVQQHAVQQSVQIVLAPDGDPIATRRIEAQQEGVGDHAQRLQRQAIGLGRIGMIDHGPHVPGTSPVGRGRGADGGDAGEVLGAVERAAVHAVSGAAG